MKHKFLIAALCICLAAFSAGCAQKNKELSTNADADYRLGQSIEKEIQEGITSDEAQLLYNGAGSVTALASGGSVSVTARVGQSQYIPAVIETLCPAAVNAISAHEMEIAYISVQYYLEADSSMDASTLVSWQSPNGESGTFIDAASGTTKVNVSAADLYEYYSDFYAPEEEAEEEAWYGDMLNAFQGEWRDGDSNWHLIIHGDTVDSLYYEAYGDSVDEDNHSTYKFILDENGALVVTKSNSPTWVYSINEDGQLLITGIKFGNTSLYDKVSDNTELPEIYKRSAPKIGMTQSQVIASTWGSPKKRNKTQTAYTEREQWVYDNGYIYFDDGIVTSIQKK